MHKKHEYKEHPAAKIEASSTLKTSAEIAAEQRASFMEQTTSISQKEMDELRAQAAKAQENWDRLLRTQADLENYRKRVARERQDLIKMANEKLLLDLLVPLDHFEMGLQSVQSQNSKVSDDSLRQGMEMVLMLFQIQDAQIVSGILLGVLAAAAVAVAWQQFGYLINMKTFFRVTSVFLLLFILQVSFQAFHEFTEAGIFPNSEYLHEISEPFSSQGVYGKMYLNAIFFGCAFWLIIGLVLDRIKVVGNKK